MSQLHVPQSRFHERLAAFGAASAMTLAVMAGIGVLAQTQQAAPEAWAPLQAQAPQLIDTTPQRVLVVGQRAPQQVLVVGQRAPRT